MKKNFYVTSYRISIEHGCVTPLYGINSIQQKMYKRLYNLNDLKLKQQMNNEQKVQVTDTTKMSSEQQFVTKK